MNRDPIGEKGGVTQMAYVVNSPCSRVGILGRLPIPGVGCCSGRNYMKALYCCRDGKIRPKFWRKGDPTGIKICMGKGRAGSVI